MMQQSDGHVRRRSRTRRATTAAVVVALAATACSGGGKSPAATRRGTTSSSAAQVLGEKVDNDLAPLASGGDASRFSLDDGTTVLVPTGALAKGAQVRVRRAAAGVGAGDGAIEGGPAAYEVSVTSGTIQKPIAVQVAVPEAAGRTAAVAVRYDDATKAWTPENSDAAPGTLTIYASKPGTFGWVRWSWEGAASVAAQTVRTVVGAADSAESATVSCGDATALAQRFSARGSNAGALRWCAGTASGEDRVQVTNRAEAPVTLDVTGLVDGATTRRSPLTEGVVEIVRRHAPTPGGSALDVLAPGDRGSYKLTAETAARAGVTQDGRSQYYVAVSGAAAFAAGLFAGSPAAGAAVLADEAVRRALLVDLDAPGCADAVGAESADERPADAVATSLRTLVTRCVTPATATAIVTAAGKRSELRAAFAARTMALPADAAAYLPAAAAFAVEPLVAAFPGGEVTLTPVVPEPTTTTSAPGATTSAGATTTAVGATTTTMPIQFNTTTVQTTPGGSTTTAVAGPTTTRAAATTTTTAAVAPPVLTLLVRSCLAAGTSLPVSGTGLTPSQRWLLTYTPPRGNNVTTQGTATLAGTMSSTFNCNGRTRGTWSLTLTDTTSGRVSVPITFTVI